MPSLTGMLGSSYGASTTGSDEWIGIGICNACSPTTAWRYNQVLDGDRYVVLFIPISTHQPECASQGSLA